MRFRAQIAWALVIQGAGAVAVLLAALLISVVLGPVAQGTFSRAKAELDFASALVMLGLPQSLFYYVHSARLSTARAMSLAAQLAAVGAVGGAAYALVSLRWLDFTAICFSVAMAAAVWHGSLRALVLAVTSTRAFNVVTALPQGLLFIYALTAIMFGGVTYIAASAAFAAAYGIAGVVSTVLLRSGTAVRLDRGHATVPLRTVFQYGLASGLAAIGSTLSVLLALRVVLWRLGATDLGIFSLAAVIAQGMLVPLNYVVPLLFKRWMRQPAPRVPLLSGMVVASGLCALAGVAYLIGTCPLCNARLATYAPISGVLWILLLASGADACNRVLAVAANAAGRPWASTLAEAARLAVIALALIALPTERMSDVAWIVCSAAVVSGLLMTAFHCVYGRRAELAR